MQATSEQAEPSAPASFADLPEELVLNTLRFVPQLDGGWSACARVCRQWNWLVRDHRTEIVVEYTRSDTALPYALIAACATKQPLTKRLMKQPLTKQ